MKVALVDIYVMYHHIPITRCVSIYFKIYFVKQGLAFLPFYSVQVLDVQIKIPTGTLC